MFICTFSAAILEPPRIVMTAVVEEDFSPIEAFEEEEKERAKFLGFINA